MSAVNNQARRHYLILYSLYKRQQVYDSCKLFYLYLVTLRLVFYLRNYQHRYLLSTKALYLFYLVFFLSIALSLLFFLYLFIYTSVFLLFSLSLSYNSDDILNYRHLIFLSLFLRHLRNIKRNTRKIRMMSKFCSSNSSLT